MPEALTPWTDQRIATAVHLWNKTGASASDIAEQLGGTSRRAVLGKLYRLGELGKRRPSASTPAEKVAKPPRSLARKPAQHQRLQSGSPAPRAKAKPSIPVVAGAVSAYLTATMFGVEGTLALEPGMCRWPFGDPRKGIAYCGRRADGSYCDHHHKRAHR